MSQETAFFATVRAADGARWSRARGGAVERVRLDEGSLSIQVRHRNEGEQFFVDLPDGVLQDQGTTFEVEVHGGHTTHVTVTEGSVALDIRGAREILLRAGTSWSPSVVAAAPSTSPSATRPSAARADDDGSEQYAIAVSLLRNRRYTAAATAFDDYVQAHPREPDAEDASYLKAVALAQARDSAGAEHAAEAHLARYPKSFHRKEASLLLARLARDDGDCAKARQILAPWLGPDADTDALATLQACLPP